MRKESEGQRRLREIEEARERFGRDVAAGRYVSRTAAVALIGRLRKILRDARSRLLTRHGPQAAASLDAPQRALDGMADELKGPTQRPA